MKKILFASALASIMISCNQTELINNQANLMTVENATVGTNFIPGKYIVVLKSTPETKGMPKAVRDKVVALLTANGANAAARVESIKQNFSGHRPCSRI